MCYFIADLQDGGDRTERQDFKWINVSNGRLTWLNFTYLILLVFTCFFFMKEFKPIPGAGGFQVSNPSVLNMISLFASLELYSKTSMVHLRAKSILLTGYLEYLLDKQLNGLGFKIITPRDPHQRGCQLSLKFLEKNIRDKVSRELMSYGIVTDERDDTIRVAPTPMYNSFSEIFKFVKALKIIMSDLGLKK
jgi:kynureninase